MKGLLGTLENIPYFNFSESTGGQIDSVQVSAPLDSHQKPHKARASCQLLLTHMPSRRPVTLSGFMDVQMEAGNEARLSPRTQKVLKLSLPDFHMLF